MPAVHCDQCGRRCASAQRLRQHKRCHEKKHVCPEQKCVEKDVRFGTKRDLQRHLHTHNRNKTASSSTDGLCPFCKLPVGGVRRDNLARHIQRQHKDQLFIAASNGDEAAVKRMLENGTDVNMVNTRSETSLLLASRNGHAGVVGLLLRHQARLDLVDRRGLTPLHHAILNNHPIIVQLLLKENINLGSMKLIDGKDLLSVAAENGYITILQTLLEHGVDIEVKAKKQWTPLMWASNSGHSDCARLLLDRGANARVKCKMTKKMPLHLAVEKESIETVSVLLDARADASARDSWMVGWRTALHYAAERGCLEIVKLLLEAGAYINSIDLEGRTPIMAAMKSKDLETVRYLLEMNPNVHLRDHGARTLLHHGAGSSGEILKLLLEHAGGADIHSADKNGGTPIYYASNADVAKLLIQHGANLHVTDNAGRSLLYDTNAEVSQLLIQHGLDVNMRDHDGNTPLHFAQDRDTAEVLCRHGATIDVYERNNAGETPLHKAADRGEAGVVRFFVENHGAEVNSKDDHDRTPLHHALRGSLSPKTGDVARLLLQLGADVNARDNAGQTPLHFLVSRQPDEIPIDVLQILLQLEVGADVNARDNEGQTPLHIHFSTGFIYCVSALPTDVPRLLLARGADLHMRNNKGRTPLHVLAERKWTARSLYSMVQYLLQHGANPRAKDNEGKTPSQVMRFPEFHKIVFELLRSLEDQTETAS